MDWSKNPFWDTLNIMLKCSNLQYLHFVFHLPNSFLISLRSIFDLNVICARSCGRLEAFWLPISLKTSSQQPCFWISMKKHCIFLYWHYHIDIITMTTWHWHHYIDIITMTSLQWHHYNDIITMTSLQGHNDNDIMIMITLGWLWEDRDRIYWPLLVLFKTWTMFFYFLGKPKKCNRGLNTCPPPKIKTFQH